MLSIYLLGALILAQASADKDPSKLGQKHGCTSDGRYWVHQDKGKKVYCFEGAGYGEDNAPPFVKSYFDESASGGGASPQQKSVADVPFIPVGSSPKSSSGGGSGGGGGGGGGANPKVQGVGPGGSSPGTGDSRAGQAAGGKIKDALREVARGPAPGASSMAPGKREPEPISLQVLNEIENGMDRATVLAKLGEPHGKILNTGDEGSLEIWTYVVRSGAFGSVRLDGGKVIKVVKPR